MALAGGGSEASEAAVEAGLKWLVAHQAENGSWSFLFDEPTLSAMLESVPQSGRYGIDDGIHRAVPVMFPRGGLYPTREGSLSGKCFPGTLLFDQQNDSHLPDGGDLRDVSVMTNPVDNLILVRKSGDMYSHAIATLALCEAYAMTRDSSLKGPAQEAY